MTISEVRNYILDKSLEFEERLLLSMVNKKDIDNWELLTEEEKKRWREKLKDKWEKHKGKLKVIGAVLGIASLAAIYLGLRSGYLQKTVDNMSKSEKHARARADNFVRKYAAGKQTKYGKTMGDDYYQKVYTKVYMMNDLQRKNVWRKEWEYFKKTKSNFTMSLLDYIAYREKMFEVFKTKYAQSLNDFQAGIKNQWNKFYQEFMRQERDRAAEFAKKQRAWKQREADIDEDETMSDAQKKAEKDRMRKEEEEELRRRAAAFANFRTLNLSIERYINNKFGAGPGLGVQELESLKYFIREAAKRLGVDKELKSKIPEFWESIIRKLRAVYGRS